MQAALHGHFGREPTFREFGSLLLESLNQVSKRGKKVGSPKIGTTEPRF